jgi:hypothetical protein
MFKLENATWGNPLTDIIAELKNIYENDVNVHIASRRPTAQQTHQKFEIVVVTDGFNRGEDIALRNYRIHLDVYTTGSETEHGTFINLLDAAITNRTFQTYAGIEVTSIQAYDRPLGDKAYNTGVTLTALRNAKNFI